MQGNLDIMIKTLMRVSFAAALMFAATVAKADSVGSQGFADLGSPSVSPGADINNATQFTIGSLITNSNSLGVFAGISTQSFGSVTFDTTNPTSLSFGNATFGTFSSTSITQTSNTAGSVSFNILGNFVGGSYTGTLTPNPAPASFTISFTQTPAGTGAISDSSSLSIPPVASSVPEPSSIMLVGLGVVSMGVVARRKKAAVVA